MQMSPRCEGDFTTNPSVVAQISKRQDVCLVKSYNSRTFACESYLQDNTSLAIFAVFVLKAKFSFKIAAAGEGRKPSHEQYIVESEFALLGILSKQCLMIHFYLEACRWTTLIEAEIIINVLLLEMRKALRKCERTH